MLEDFEYLIDRAACHPMTVRDRNNPVEPAVFLGCCFIVRSRPHVVFGRTDALASGQTVHHFLWTMTHAEIRHADESAVVGLQEQADIQGGRAVASQRLPVAPAR